MKQLVVTLGSLALFGVLLAQGQAPRKMTAVPVTETKMKQADLLKSSDPKLAANKKLASRPTSRRCPAASSRFPRRFRGWSRLRPKAIWYRWPSCANTTIRC